MRLCDPEKKFSGEIIRSAVFSATKSGLDYFYLIAGVAKGDLSIISRAW